MVVYFSIPFVLHLCCSFYSQQIYIRINDYYQRLGLLTYICDFLYEEASAHSLLKPFYFRSTISMIRNLLSILNNGLVSNQKRVHNILVILDMNDSLDLRFVWICHIIAFLHCLFYSMVNEVKRFCCLQK